MRSLRVLSFAVSLFIICGIIFGPISASALYELEIDPWGDLEDVKNPGITDTPMAPELPDPPDQEDPAGEEVSGGISLLSLNDDDLSRTVKITGSITYGRSSSDKSTYSGGTKSFEAGGVVTLATYTATAAKTTYIKVPGGTTVDFTAPVDFTSDVYESVTVTGSGSISLACVGGGVSATAEPDEVVFLVNGVETGEILDINDTFTMLPLDLDLSVPVTSIGYRFTWTTADTVSMTGTVTNGVRNLRFSYGDLATVVAVEKPQEPEYNGLLGAIIGWLQNLWDAITGLPGRIVNGLLDGLSGLFVPSEEDVTALKAKYDTLLRDRLGFIYQGFDATVTNVETIVTNMEAAEVT